MKKGIYLGIIFILISIISRGIFSIKAKEMLNSTSAINITFSQILYGFVFYLVSFLISLFFYKDINYISILLKKEFILGLVYLSLLSTVLVFYFNNIALKYLTVSNAGLLNSVTSLVSAFAGVFFLKEKMNLSYVLGLIVIIFCVVFYNRSLVNKK